MEKFAWIDFYEAFAARLLEWDNNRAELFDKIRAMAGEYELMDYLHFSNAEFWQERDYEIDPFTVTGIFNRGTTDAHRHEMALKVSDIIGLKNADPPLVFHGIPHLDPRKSIYDGNEQMWTLMKVCLADGAPEAQFERAWDAAIEVSGNALGTLSIGLYWAQPLKFMPIDKLSAPLLKDRYELTLPGDKCSGAEYTQFLKTLNEKKGETSFPSIALEAWRKKHEAA